MNVKEALEWAENMKHGALDVDPFRVLAAEVRRLEVERDRLRGFAQAVMEVWPEGDMDCGDLQDIAVNHGILEPQQMASPCSESCYCAEYYGPDDWPITCYRHTELMK